MVSHSKTKLGHARINYKQHRPTPFIHVSLDSLAPKSNSHTSQKGAHLHATGLRQIGHARPTRARTRKNDARGKLRTAPGTTHAARRFMRDFKYDDHYSCRSEAPREPGGHRGGGLAEPTGWSLPAGRSNGCGSPRLGCRTRRFYHITMVSE